jgi:2'-5' RNA ligase
MKVTPSALTAFCLSSNRLRHCLHCRHLRQGFGSFFPLRAASNEPPSTDSSQPINPLQAPSAEDRKDWFVDGRDTARRLKIELGLMSEEENTASTDDGDDGMSSASIETSSRDDAMESGRKAALEFLKSLNDDENHDSNPKTTEEQSNETLETTIGQSSQLFSDKQFTFPSRKSHSLTICLVPPPSATTAWERLNDVRRELKDPGFYRWPPHANLLYPFLEPNFDKESEKSEEEQMSEFRKQLIESLTSVASQCKPFDVEIDTFGLFGGKTRGVLWARPKSKYSSPAAADYDSDEEPLITLQTLLEKHFPTCTDQRKQGTFAIHITLSHYANITDALEAKGQVESKWESTSFHVPEVYLLQRQGDDGQFKILAKIPLGLQEDDEVHLFDEPLAFPAMPVHEEEWVYNERMTMKNRRKNNFKRSRKGEKSLD